jgi:hypothetical protein
MFFCEIVEPIHLKRQLSQQEYVGHEPEHPKNDSYGEILVKK